MDVKPEPATLTDVDRALRSAWGRDTTCLDAAGLLTWTPDIPARGQCGPTALVLQDLLGGELLLAGVTRRGLPDGTHYWNRFGSGFELDLTREQFGAEQVIGEPRVVVRPIGGPRAYVGEYELLRSRVLTELGRTPTA